MSESSFYIFAHSKYVPSLNGAAERLEQRVGDVGTGFKRQCLSIQVASLCFICVIITDF